MNFEIFGKPKSEMVPEKEKTEENSDSLLKKALENPKLRRIAFATAFVFGMGSQVEAGQNFDTNSDKESEGDKTEQVIKSESNEKTFENNVILRESIREWIHFLKTGEYTGLDLGKDGNFSEKKAQKESSIKESEERKVYEYLVDHGMDVWNLSELTAFSSQLWALKEDMEEKGINRLDIQYQGMKDDVAGKSGDALGVGGFDVKGKPLEGVGGFGGQGYVGPDVFLSDKKFSNIEKQAMNIAADLMRLLNIPKHIQK
jgi:hypothetical protein